MRPTTTITKMQFIFVDLRDLLSAQYYTASLSWWYNLAKFQCHNVNGIHFYIVFVRYTGIPDGTNTRSKAKDQQQILSYSTSASDSKRSFILKCYYRHFLRLHGPVALGKGRGVWEIQEPSCRGWKAKILSI